MLMFVMTWLFYDAVLIKRKGEEGLEKLQSRTAAYYNRLDLFSKREVMRRSRALRSVYVPVGEFAEVSLDMVVTAWEEVLNQLLFLLSL